MPRCYNCNSPYHYSDRCTKPAPKSQCYNCGGSGHKKEFCPVQKVNRDKPVEQAQNKSGCYLCGDPSHKKDFCPRQVMPPQARQPAPVGIQQVQPKLVPQMGGYRLTQELKTTIKFAGMWGANSVLIDPNSELGLLKSKFLDTLLGCGFITMEECDKRNRTGHIDIKGSAETFGMLNGSSVVINNISLVIEDNLILLNILGNYHMTLVFSRGIKQHAQYIYEILDGIIDQLNKIKIAGAGFGNQIAAAAPDAAPEPVPNLEAKATDSQLMLCCICMSNIKSIKISPCNHVCICSECEPHVIKLKSCPMCRTGITGLERVYL